MAIARVNIPTPTAPVGVADYQAQLDQITALNQAFTGRNPVDGSTIRAGTVMMVGSVLYKATSDTTITGVASLYVKITPAGATASAAFVANLTGVTWNHAYGGYYDGSGNLYLFDEALALDSGVIATAYTGQSLPGRTRRALYTASGSFTVPAGVTTLYLTGIGSGGNGGKGGVTGTLSPGGGGGGGGGGAGQTVVKYKVTVTPGAVATITIGQGVATSVTGAFVLTLAKGVNGSDGSPGTGGGGAGGAGGAGAGYQSSAGGPGGNSGIASVTGPAAGNDIYGFSNQPFGSPALGGGTAASGGSGGSGPGGSGAPSIFGKGADGIVGGANLSMPPNGNDAVNPGSGGGGQGGCMDFTTNTNRGGLGAAGALLVEW